MDTANLPTVTKKQPTRHPWAELFALRQFLLVKGRDFFCPAYSMAQQIRNAAKPQRHNKLVSIRIAKDGGSIFVTVRNRNTRKGRVA